MYVNMSKMFGYQVKEFERNVGILFHEARTITQSNDYFVITLYY